MIRKTIVITGIGPVTPIGIGVDSFWKACCEGRSGISPIRSNGNGNNRPDIGVVGKINDFSPVDFLSKAKLAWMDRFSHIAIFATYLALEDAGIDLSKENRCKIGVFCGSCLGGMIVAEEQLNILHTKGPRRVRPKLVPANMLNSAAGEIAIAFGLKGPNLTVSNSHICSAEAIGLAYDAFQMYDLNIMVVGGIDAPLGNLTTRSLLGSQFISKCSTKPFDLNRDGFVLSEGGAFLIMERLEHARQRDALPYAEYAGYGRNRGGSSQSSQALLRAAKSALSSASLGPGAVDYIHAFGMATEQGDKLETRAIKGLLKERALRVPVSAVKSMIGHCLGGAAAIEIAVGALTISSKRIVPTINYKTPDPDCDLDYVPNTGREAEVGVALIHALGMGGESMVSVLKKFQE